MVVNRTKNGLLFLVIFFTFTLAACSSNPATTDISQVEKKSPGAVISNPASVLQAESDKYLKLNKPLFVEPQEVMTKVVASGDPGYVLVDIRNDEHYAAAHIPGAIHIAYTDIWREQKVSHLPKDKKIIIVDYSGHTASQAAALWNMLGFDAVAMKNGMAGWSKDKEVIGGSPLVCEAQNYPVAASPVTFGQYQLPALEIKAYSFTDLVLQASKAATETAPVIQPKDLKDKLTSYYVVDLRQAAHYQAGHIDGSVNIPFRNLAEIENLKKLPADKNIALVCYDGHAASQAARLLNQLRYHATALKDGMSVWSSDEKVIGAKTIACNVAENPVIKLNAQLKAAPSTAAT